MSKSPRLVNVEKKRGKVIGVRLAIPLYHRVCGATATHAKAQGFRSVSDFQRKAILHYLEHLDSINANGATQ